MKTWKGYNLLDLILISSGTITILVTGIIFKSPWYIILNTLFGLLCVFTQAKGKIISLFLGVIFMLFYIYISYRQKYFGEAIINLLIMLPLYIYGIIHWIRHKDKVENVVIVRNNLSLKEWIFSSIGIVITSIISYFILKALDTNKLILSTISFATGLPAIYLLVRRCKLNQVAFIINDIICPLLWLALVLENKLEFLSLFIYHFFQLLYDIYGLIEWNKLEKKQKTNEPDLKENVLENK